VGGVEAAWADVAGGFSAEHFASRGGVYEWGQPEEALRLQRNSWL